MAHFLGAGDAKRFLSELHRDPNQSAPSLFPRPAAANQAIFYHQGGAPRDLGEVMDLMQGKMRRAIAQNGRLPQASPRIAPSTQDLFGDDAGLINPRRATREIAALRAIPFPLGGMQLDPGIPRLSPDLMRADPGPRPPMSDLLMQSFSLGAGSTNSAATEQVERAYAQLKAVGL